VTGTYGDERTASHPELEDQAEALLTANSVPEMREAADRLRQTALSVRRLLMRPALMDTPLQLDPSVSDPEVRRVELADLAVDVVAAVDYLLSLLGAPSITSRELLATEARSDSRHAAAEQAALDRLNRQRLDARSTAVRLGMRLLGELHSDVANS
jgi:conjugal transfer/entry exclusion protein